MENYLQMKLMARCIKPIGIIHEDASISIAWLRGMPLDREKSKQEVDYIVKGLETAEALVEKMVTPA
jgi:hypothetical protein